MANENSRAQGKDESASASLPYQANLGKQKKDSFRSFEPASSNRKGIAAIHVLVLTLFLVGIIVVFVAMVNNANFKEFKILRTNVDIMNVESMSSLFKSSLEASWRTITTQIVFSELEARFGLPEYFYNLSGATTTPDLMVSGCTADGRTCIPTTTYVNTRLAQAIGNISLPNSFEIFVRLGRGIRELNRNMIADTTKRSLFVSANRVYGEIDQSIFIGGSETVLDTGLTIVPEISTQLSTMLGMTQQLISAASQLRATSNTVVAYADSRDKTISALQGWFESNSDNLANLFPTSTVESRYRLLPSWSSTGSELRLTYDANIHLSDDNQTIVSGLVNESLGQCQTLQTDLYNKYADVIERANPDRLLAWVEEPRALLAAIVEEFSQWNPNAVTLDSGGTHNGLFGVIGGSLVPSENAEQAVDALERAFKANATMHDALVNYINASDGRAWNIITAYDSWKPCVTASQSTDLSASNPKRIFGPEDYAQFLSDKTDTTVRIGDDFCSASDYSLRGYTKLAYDFYSDADRWDVYPAYPGRIIRIDPQPDRPAPFDGCGGAVWVQTGDFIVVYGHVFPSSSRKVGDIVTPTGTIATARLGSIDKTRAISNANLGICKDGALTVVILKPSWKVPGQGSVDEFSSCGTRMSYTQLAPGVYQLPDRQVLAGGTVQSIETGPLDRHMAAIEWDGVFRERSDGRYWRLRERGEWEQAPIALDFKMTDSFASLTCPSSGTSLYKWQNENDLLCVDGKLWSCVNDVQGASTSKTGDVIGGYRCSSKDPRFVTVPASSPTYWSYAYDYFISGKRMARWCTAGELNSNWLCCVGSQTAMQMTCTNQRYTVDGESLICADGSCTELLG